mmetsp:Transcript_4994/g.7054  ORF Transcript_4994/g.7054 Transcript_4994/m.7054 type:complete len:266 (+) Transcript_4994:929-1726(+)
MMIVIILKKKKKKKIFLQMNLLIMSSIGLEPLQRQKLDGKKNASDEKSRNCVHVEQLVLLKHQTLTLKEIHIRYFRLLTLRLLVVLMHLKLLLFILMMTLIKTRKKIKQMHAMLNTIVNENAKQPLKKILMKRIELLLKDAQLGVVTVLLNVLFAVKQEMRVLQLSLKKTSHSLILILMAMLILYTRIIMIHLIRNWKMILNWKIMMIKQRHVGFPSLYLIIYQACQKTKKNYVKRNVRKLLNVMSVESKDNAVMMTTLSLRLLN